MLQHLLKTPKIGILAFNDWFNPFSSLVSPQPNAEFA
jgi:hypothetical protein